MTTEQVFQAPNGKEAVVFLRRDSCKNNRTITIEEPLMLCCNALLSCEHLFYESVMKVHIVYVHAVFHST